jgi:hypothetical protein
MRIVMGIKYKVAMAPQGFRPLALELVPKVTFVHQSCGELLPNTELSQPIRNSQIMRTGLLENHTGKK